MTATTKINASLTYLHNFSTNANIMRTHARAINCSRSSRSGKRKRATAGIEAESHVAFIEAVSRLSLRLSRLHNVQSSIFSRPPPRRACSESERASQRDTHLRGAPAFAAARRVERQPLFDPRVLGPMVLRAQPVLALVEDERRHRHPRRCSALLAHQLLHL